MASELQTRYPKLRQFLFYVVVNKGFIQSANASTNNVLKRLQGGPDVSHYNTALSNNGDNPVTRWGASGLVRAREAYSLFDYYDSMHGNDVTSAVLTPDGRMLWSKKDGWLDPPVGPLSYEEFLQFDPPKLKIIEEPNETPTSVIT